MVETEAFKMHDEGNIKGYSPREMFSRWGQRSPTVLASQISALLNVHALLDLVLVFLCLCVIATS